MGSCCFPMRMQSCQAANHRATAKYPFHEEGPPCLPILRPQRADALAFGLATWISAVCNTNTPSNMTHCRLLTNPPVQCPRHVGWSRISADYSSRFIGCEFLSRRSTVPGFHVLDCLWYSIRGANYSISHLENAVGSIFLTPTFHAVFTDMSVQILYWHRSHFSVSLNLKAIANP